MNWAFVAMHANNQANLRLRQVFKFFRCSSLKKNIYVFLAAKASVIGVYLVNFSCFLLVRSRWPLLPIGWKIRKLHAIILQLSWLMTNSMLPDAVSYQQQTNFSNCASSLLFVYVTIDRLMNHWTYFNFCTNSKEFVIFFLKVGRKALRNVKTCSGPSLDLDLSIHSNKGHIHLMTQYTVPLTLIYQAWGNVDWCFYFLEQKWYSLEMDVNKPFLSLGEVTGFDDFHTLGLL